MLERSANRWPWLLAIAAAVMVVGCGEDRPRVVDPLLLPYVEEFETMGDWHVTTSVVFGEVGFGPDTLGGISQGDAVCHPSDRLIVISELYRFSAEEQGEPDAEDTLLPGTEDQVHVLVFHELGHCELGLPHTAPTDPIGIMNPGGSAFAGIFLEDWDHYVALLFGHDG